MFTDTPHHYIEISCKQHLIGTSQTVNLCQNTAQTDIDYKLSFVGMKECKVLKQNRPVNVYKKVIN